MGLILDTFAAALYVRIDGLLAGSAQWARQRPRVGFVLRLSDAGLVTLAVVSALVGSDDGSRFVRYAHARLRPWFSCLPDRAGFNKRLRASAQMIAGVTGRLARERGSWHDDVWLAGSAPAGPSSPTRAAAAKTSKPTSTTADRTAGPAVRPEAPRPGAALPRPPRRTTESVNWTLTGQLTLERHNACTKTGTAARAGTRHLVLTTANWHNQTTQRPGPTRSHAP